MLLHLRRLSTAVPLACLLLAMSAACTRSTPPASSSTNGGEPPKTEAPEPPAAADRRPKIVVLGDSLTAGLGLAPADAFPSVLQRKIDASGLQFEVVNAGVSGDTSAGGLRRLDWSLQPDARILVLALGANDGLRGLPVAEMKRNLSTIIETAQARHVSVVLTGMEAPPNYGAEYAVAFRQAFPDLSKRYKIPLVPFLLDRVAGQPSLNQGDGIHPNVRGAQMVADTVWATLKLELDRLTTS
jgi:acyl-CoA thioesterase-1